MNPYIYSYSQFAQDTFYNTISNRWSSVTSPYGPLFILISGILTWIGSKSLLFSLFLFKSLFVGSHLLVTYYIYKIADLKAAFVYALNPLIIFEFVINGHNDVIVLLMVVISIYFLQKKDMLKNQLLSWVFLIISSLLKITTIIFWPIFWLLLFKENLKNKTSGSFIFLSLFIATVIFFLFYASFLSSLEALYKPIINQGMLTGYYSLGITLVYLLVNLFNFNNLNLSIIINLVIFSIVYLLIIFKITYFKVIDYRTDLLKYITFIILIFCLTCLKWFMPWYLGIIIALSALSFFKNKSNYYLFLINFFTLYGIFYYYILR